MSLNDAPFGFRAIRTLNGGEVRTGEYTVSSATNRIYRGDVVALNTAGLVVRHAASGAVSILGAAAEEFNSSGTAGVKMKVFDDPSTVYEAQCNNTAAITQAKFGNPYRIVATAGDSSLGYSKEEIDIGTSAQSATYVVKAIRLSPKEDNDLSQNSVIECILAGDPTEAARA